MFSYFEKRVDPYPPEEPERPPERFLPFCWYYTRPVAGWVLLMALLTAVLAAGEVILFGFLGNLVDWLSASKPDGFLQREGWTLLGIAVFLLMFLPAVSLFHSVITHQTLLGNYPMIARWQMHRYLLKQSIDFFANEFAGRVATRVMQTSLAVREAVMKVADIMVYVAVYFVSMIVIIGNSDWRLAMPMVLWVVIYIGVIAYFVPRLKRASAEQADARSMMTGRVVDSYTNINTVKLFSHAGREATYARESMDEFLGTVHKQMRFVTKFEVAVEFNNALVVFLIGSLSIWLWMNSLVTTGAIAVAVALALRLNGMSQWIMWEVSSLFENIGVIHDGMSMMAKRRSISDQPDAKPLAVTEGKITFEKITFNYGKAREETPGEDHVIRDFSLEIAPGEKLGLVGRSGAGKTTLVNLLLRFYDVEGGKVMIDGQDIAGVSQGSLREAIGVVTQDTSLLHRSIRDNIAYSRPDATDEQVIAAAKKARAWEFIQTLEDQQGRKGLDAHVGERGVKLSGGQRQRIAISRVFLKDAPILVLDEATSALDSEVEAAIQESLFDLMEGKTVIAIAHRLSTIASLDRLIVMNRGQIVESGTHEALIADDGLYAELWSRQSGGFLGIGNTERLAG